MHRTAVCVVLLVMLSGLTRAVDLHGRHLHTHTLTQSESSTSPTSSTSAEQSESGQESSVPHADPSHPPSPHARRRENVLRGKINIIRNENDLVSHMKPAVDNTLANEEMVKRLESKDARLRRIEQALVQRDREDEERRKKMFKDEAVGKDQKRKEREEDLKRYTSNEAAQKEGVQKAAAAQQQQAAIQEEDNKKKAAQARATEEGLKRGTACRKKRAEPSVYAGQFDLQVQNYPNGWNFAGSWTFDSRAAIVGDFNGDGRSDYARLGDTYSHFMINKGDGTFYLPFMRYQSGWSFGWDENVWTTLPTLDLNGDGKMDYVRLSPRSGYAFISKGSNDQCWFRDGEVDINQCFTISAFQYPDGWNFQGDTWTFNDPKTVTADFNGDGKTDFARLGPSNILFFFSQGDGTFWMNYWRYPSGYFFETDENIVTSVVGDFNGDCRYDILRTRGRFHDALMSNRDQDDATCFHTSGEIRTGCFTLTRFYYPNGWNFYGAWTWNSRAMIKGDFNGDGNWDFGRLGATYMHLFISQGNGQYYYPVYQYPFNLNFGWDENVWTTLPQGDFDGDGKYDIVRSYSTAHHAFFSRGSDSDCWFQNGEIPAACFKVTRYEYPNGLSFAGATTWNSKATVVADFNGDRKDDFANLLTGTYASIFVSK